MFSKTFAVGIFFSSGSQHPFNHIILPLIPYPLSLLASHSTVCYTAIISKNILKLFSELHNVEL